MMTSWQPLHQNSVIPKHEVLCINANDFHMIGCIVRSDDSFTGFMARSDVEIMYNVVAWMPLPPSYKGELRGEQDE